MRLVPEMLRSVVGASAAGLALAVAGCGSPAGTLMAPPITVSLVLSTIELPQDGTQVGVPITITSTSETALVTVSPLPAGVGVKYAASDTNPSGELFFTANAVSQAGTTMPFVTVYSAGQTAMTTFTLIVGTVVKTGNADYLLPSVHDVRRQFSVQQAGRPLKTGSRTQYHWPGTYAKINWPAIEGGDAAEISEPFVARRNN